MAIEYVEPRVRADQRAGLWDSDFPTPPGAPNESLLRQSAASPYARPVFSGPGGFAGPDGAAQPTTRAGRGSLEELDALEPVSDSELVPTRISVAPPEPLPVQAAPDQYGDLMFTTFSEQLNPHQRGLMQGPAPAGQGAKDAGPDGPPSRPQLKVSLLTRESWPTPSSGRVSKPTGKPAVHAVPDQGSWSGVLWMIGAGLGIALGTLALVGAVWFDPDPPLAADGSVPGSAPASEAVVETPTADGEAPGPAAAPKPPSPAAAVAPPSPAAAVAPAGPAAALAPEPDLPELSALPDLARLRRAVERRQVHLAHMESRYRQALTAQPEQARWLAGLAQVLIYRRRYTQALTFARRAVRVEPHHLGYRFVLADALAGLGKYPAARQAYRAILTQHPDNRRARLQLGRIADLDPAAPAVGSAGRDRPWNDRVFSL